MDRRKEQLKDGMWKPDSSNHELDKARLFVKVSEIRVSESDNIKARMPLSNRIVSILGRVICSEKLRRVQILHTALYCNTVLPYNPTSPLPMKF